jgi:hypothetical protein
MGEDSLDKRKMDRLDSIKPKSYTTFFFRVKRHPTE